MKRLQEVSERGLRFSGGQGNQPLAQEVSGKDQQRGRRHGRAELVDREKRVGKQEEQRAHGSEPCGERSPQEAAAHGLAGHQREQNGVEGDRPFESAWEAGAQNVIQKGGDDERCGRTEKR